MECHRFSYAKLAMIITEKRHFVFYYSVVIMTLFFEKKKSVSTSFVDEENRFIFFRTVKLSFNLIYQGFKFF
jgi:hypothetical protein